MDKQIIIDGVDVSECENFSCGICEQENKIPRTINHFTADCRMYPNCYYKQLKAKEQECEELQNKFLELNGKAHSNSLELDQLKQTLTEIKEMCNSVENIENVKSLYDAALSGMYLQANKILKKISEVISE